MYCDARCSGCVKPDDLEGLRTAEEEVSAATQHEHVDVGAAATGEDARGAAEAPSVALEALAGLAR